MREIEYEITLDDNGLPAIKYVRGYLAFVMFGFAFGVHYETDGTNWGSFDDWVITELSTGMCLTFNSPTFTKEQAVERGIKFLKEKGEKATQEAVAKRLEFLSKPIALTSI